jgi:hypothetical protein
MTRLLEQAVATVSALPDEVQDEVARMLVGVRRPRPTPRLRGASLQRTKKSEPCGRSMTFESSLHQAGDGPDHCGA